MSRPDAVVSTVVKQSPQHYKVKGSSPAAAAYTQNGRDDRRARIRHQCTKTTALSCHRCLINTGVEKMNII